MWHDVLVWFGGCAVGLGVRHGIAVVVSRRDDKREAYRIGIMRSLGRDVADRPDAVGRAVIRPATYRRAQWGGDR